MDSCPEPSRLAIVRARLLGLSHETAVIGMRVRAKMSAPDARFLRSRGPGTIVAFTDSTFDVRWDGRVELSCYYWSIGRQLVELAT